MTEDDLRAAFSVMFGVALWRRLFFKKRPTP